MRRRIELVEQPSRSQQLLLADAGELVGGHDALNSRSVLGYHELSQPSALLRQG